MTVRVSCPHCSQAYNVSDDKLGKQTTCKKCNQRFTLNQIEVEGSSPEKPTGVQAEKRSGGFFASLGNKFQEAKREIGELHEKNMQGIKHRMEESKQRKLDEQAARDASGEYQHPSVTEMLSVKFITGPIDLKPNTSIFVDVDEMDVHLLKFRPGFSMKCDEVLCIPLKAVKHLEVESAERMSLGRVGAGLLLAGPLGAAFGGFGFKKKDKFLRIDFDDAGLESSIVLGGKAETASNKIMAARREAARLQNGATE